MCFRYSLVIIVGIGRGWEFPEALAKAWCFELMRLETNSEDLGGIDLHSPKATVAKPDHAQVHATNLF